MGMVMSTISTSLGRSKGADVCEAPARGLAHTKHQVSVCWYGLYLTCYLPPVRFPLIPADSFMFLSLDPQDTNHFLLDPPQHLGPKDWVGEDVEMG